MHLILYVYNNEITWSCLGPGSGVQCRDKLCHKYATCSIVFETQSKAVCQVFIALHNNSIPSNITTFVNSILLY